MNTITTNQEPTAATIETERSAQIRRKLVVVNRKMYGSILYNKAFLEDLLHATRALKNMDCVVSVPYPYLYKAQAMLARSSIARGADHPRIFARTYCFVGSKCGRKHPYPLRRER